MYAHVSILWACLHAKSVKSQNLNLRQLAKFLAVRFFGITIYRVLTQEAVSIHNRSLYGLIPNNVHTITISYRNSFWRFLPFLFIIIFVYLFISIRRNFIFSALSFQMRLTTIINVT
jgi:hypothetical protein